MSRKIDETMAAKGYVTVSVAAGLIGVVAGSVYRLCDAGKLEHVRVGTRGRYVKKSSIAPYLGPEAARLLLRGGAK